MKMLRIGSFVGLLMLSSVSYAEFACSDLDEMRHDVAALADAVEDTFIFTREDDRILDDIVTVMYLVAEEENNRTLYDAARAMERAWEREDADAYVDALDVVTIEVDDIYYHECRRR